MSLQERPIKQLNHNGRLAMTFANRRNKTIMTNCYQLPPLRASRELYMNATDRKSTRLNSSHTS